MTLSNPQPEKKHVTLHLLIQCTIWIAAVCMMIFVFYKKITPVYTQETLNSISPVSTPELKPGDSVSQSFRSSYDHLYDTGIAVSYQEDIMEDASLLIQVLADEDLIVEQSLSIRLLPNSGFCSLVPDLPDCMGKTITIRIENTSSGSDNAVFSLLAADKSSLYLDNADNYLLNGQKQNACLLFTSTYLTGYSCYHAATYAFWVFLAALIFSSLVSKISSAQQK